MLGRWHWQPIDGGRRLIDRRRGRGRGGTGSSSEGHRPTSEWTTDEAKNVKKEERTGSRVGMGGRRQKLAEAEVRPASSLPANGCLGKSVGPRDGMAAASCCEPSPL